MTPARYTVLDRIAVGGMGEVFLARQHGIGGFSRTVVLKRLLPDSEGDDEALRRLLDEARIAGSLTHENVVTIIEVGEEAGRPFLALEYVHGENAGALRNRARKHEMDLPTVAVARIVADAARGLHHAHTARSPEGKPLHVVHRDVAPKNIFVRSDGTSKIGDFGIAKAERKLASTATGSVPGTLAYMSPEQVTGDAVGAASDQFSLGIVLWELLTGHRLFRAQSPAVTVENILQKRVRVPSRLRPDALLLDAIAMRMLDRHPANRFASLEEAALAIEAALRDARTDVGRRAVALLVERLAGDELRTRQKRIEAGADETMRTPRPILPNEAHEATPGTPGTPAGDATKVDRPRAPLAATRAPVRASWRPLAAAALTGGLIAAVAAGGALAAKLSGWGEPSQLERSRTYADKARVENAHIDRAVLLAMGALEGIDARALEAAVAVTTPLAQERLDMLSRHVAGDAAQMDAERATVFARERALEDKARAALAPLGKDFAEAALDMWAYDSSVPLQWTPQQPLALFQRDLKEWTLPAMNDQRAMRVRATDLLLKNAGADEAMLRAVHAEIDPVVAQREALISQFVDAPASALAQKAREIADLEARARRLLVARLGVSAGGAVASLALWGFPVPGDWEPTFTAMPSSREARANGDTLVER